MTTVAPKECLQVGEIFELELDGSDPKNSPMEMVKQFRPQEVSAWRHKGKVLPPGRNVGRFMLVRGKNSITSWQTVHFLEEIYGEHPPGQWLRAFQDKYQVSLDGVASVSIADISWICKNGADCYPSVVVKSGKIGFDNHINEVDEKECLWLVFAPAEEQLTPQN